MTGPTDFNPMDARWWPMDSELNWWNSCLMLNDPDRPQPKWLPDPGEAARRLERRSDWVNLLMLTHSHRTATTRQLHRLDPRLPGSPAAQLYTDLAACRLIDLGYVKSADGRNRATPRTASLMAVCLPRQRDIRPVLEDMHVDPFTIRGFGSGPLRGIRQYDRHNLICTELSCRFREHGYRTLGEAWGRFDLLFHDPTAGDGGPDLMIIRPDGLVVCVEATASGTDLNRKINRWTDLMTMHPDAGVTVIWLDCSTRSQMSSIRSLLRHIPTAGGRMHTADARQWLDNQLGVLDDGTHIDDLPGPDRPRIDPHEWCDHGIRRILGLYGLDASHWTLKPPLTGRWNA